MEFPFRTSFSFALVMKTGKVALGSMLLMRVFRNSLEVVIFLYPLLSPSLATSNAFRFGFSDDIWQG
jgi:hypothetical protein